MQVSGHETTGLSSMSHHGAVATREIVRSTPAPGKAGTDASASRSDRVDLSSSVRHAERIRQLLSEVPEVRVHRVSEAAHALQRGDLNLNGEDLADRVLSDPLHTGAAPV